MCKGWWWHHYWPKFQNNTIVLYIIWCILYSRMQRNKLCWNFYILSKVTAKNAGWSNGVLLSPPPRCCYVHYVGGGTSYGRCAGLLYQETQTLMMAVILFVYLWKFSDISPSWELWNSLPISAKVWCQPYFGIIFICCSLVNEFQDKQIVWDSNSRTIL